MRSLDEAIIGRPEPLAAGRFGIRPGLEPRPYRPLDCPSLDQFEAEFRKAAPARKSADTDERV